MAVAVLHSALASRQAKAFVARTLGERRRNAYYRSFYVTQSVLSFAGLWLYARRLPNAPVWRTSGSTAFALNAGRLAALYAFFRAAQQVGIARLSGLAGLRAQTANAPSLFSEPEAQGPAFDRPLTGPFRLSRHPLNLLGIPLLWLTPRLSRNRLAFNLVATLYFLLGSLHEEQRLRRAYGQRYAAYTREVRFAFGRRKVLPAT